MGKKKEGYIMRVTSSCDEYPANLFSYGERVRNDRLLSRAINRTNREPKKKYQVRPGEKDPPKLPKEWN